MDGLAIRLQKAAAAHCADLDLPHDLGLRLAEEFASDHNAEPQINWRDASDEEVADMADDGPDPRSGETW